jgi:DNA replication protein DnaC
MHQPTIEKLHALRLGAMANALTAQLQQPEIDAMPFAERLGLLVDIQHSTMLTDALRQRLTRAGMRQSACMENLDLRTLRALDRSPMQGLAGGLWIRQHRHVLISGAAGIGKSWIACALGNQPARDGVYADAILDRLVHNAYRLNLKGKSMRDPAAHEPAEGEGLDKTMSKVKGLQYLSPLLTQFTDDIYHRTRRL